MKLKQYEKHADVAKKYKWDLEAVLRGENIKDLIKKFFDLFAKLIETKDSKYENIDKFLESLKLDEKITLLYHRISNYISNSVSINVTDSKMKTLEEGFLFQYNEFAKRLGSESNRIFKHEAELREWLKDERLESHRKDFYSILDEKKHKLSDEIEEFLIKIARAEGDPHEVFSILSDSELVYRSAIGLDGKKYEVSSGMYMSLMQNKDEKVRKETYESYQDAHYQHANSFAYLLFERFKKLTTWAKVRQYESAIQSFLFSDRVSMQLLNSLYAACKNHKSIFQRYFELRKKYYKIKFKKDMKRWDTQVQLVNARNVYSVEEAQNLVISALEPMGKEYLGVVKQALLEENWVDYMPIKNKRSGAYSIGSSYGLDKKYILMNFDGTLRSVETLAHEMGHSMHSYYSDNNQPLNNANYPIFLAEIASIFNELMLFDYLFKTSKNDEFKFEILTSLIDGFEGSVMRQVEWSNFEFELYNAIEKGEPYSTYEQISKLYYENAKSYERGWKVTNESKLLIRSVTVPHYYYSFYVYKYAIGQICANIFYQKYQQEGPDALQNYINNFLKKGSSKWPLEILQDSGIDLYDEKVYELAFMNIEKRVKEFEELGDKLFPSKPFKRKAN